MTDIINSKVFSFTNIEDAFSECTRITNLKTGITVSLLPSNKLLFVRMRHRFNFFVKQRGRRYYDNIDQLGESAGVKYDAASDAIKKLQAVGLISGTIKGRSYQWESVADLTPENFLFERDINAMKRKNAPEWVDCLKHPVFGNAKEDVTPEVQEEKQPVPEADPMCEMDEIEEEDAPAPEKVKPTSKPKIKKPVTPPAAPSDDKEYFTKLRQFESAGHWYQFSEYQLPDLERFKRDGKLTNEYALAYLDKHTPQQTMNT